MRPLTITDLRLAPRYVMRGLDYHLSDDPVPALLVALALMLMAAIAFVMPSVTIGVLTVVMGIAHVVRLGLQGFVLGDKDISDG